MPAMVRAAGKAKKIAYGILGVPANLQKKSKKKKKTDQVLLFQETARVR
jgi:hypothetical protein